MMFLEERFVRTNNRLTRTHACGSAEFVSSIAVTETSSETELQAKWDKALLQGAIPRSDAPKNVKLRVADLFCGAGGLSQGILQTCRSLSMTAEFCLAGDQDGNVLETYCRNFDPRIVATKNIASYLDYHIEGRGGHASFTYTPEVMDFEISRLHGAIDLMVAGPPCQGHSNLNNHTRNNDPRNSLYLAVPAFAVALNVPHLVIENVPEVERDDTGVLATARALLESSEYKVKVIKLRATEYGVPQTRTRLFLLASKHGLEGVEAARNALRRPERPISWAIEDLVDVAGPTLFDMPPAMDETNQRRAEWLHENNEWDLPDRERPDCHKDGHTYKSVYGRMYWDRPSLTITRGFSVAGRGRYIHALRPRTLTPHEAARLQGFPDSFKFETRLGKVPARGDLTKMIGNAVPPVFGEICTLGLVIGSLTGQPGHHPLMTSA